MNRPRAERPAAVTEPSAALRLLRSHLEASHYHAGIDAVPCLQLRLAPRGDEAADGEARGVALVELAALAIAETFGLLDAARSAPVRRAMTRALAGEIDGALALASADTALAWCTAAGEWCEREGLDEAFARLQTRAAAADRNAAAEWRVYWRIASAWHHESFGRGAEVGRLLREAQAIADGGGTPALRTIVALELAKLALARSDAASALARARAAVAEVGEDVAPLWHAHAADVAARVALLRGDFHHALHCARRCHGLAVAAAAPPAYCVTFRLNEAYALAGLGAYDEAVTIVGALAEVPQPAHLRERLRLLAQLIAFGRDVAAGGAPRADALADALRRLRELQWPGVLAPLPRLLARLWGQALQQGLEVDWVVASIRSRDLLPPAPCWPQAWPWAVRLRVLGPFEVEAEAMAPAAGRAASRPLELLRRLAVQGGFDGLAVDPLAQALWPGEAREGRGKAFETTLARLRKGLGCADAVLLHEHRLRLNPRRVWLDRVAFERLLDELADPALAGQARQNRWLEALALWRGAPLAGEPDADAPWLRSAREALRNRLAAALLADAALPGHKARCLRALATDPALADRV
jgi:hypothetical protein